MESIVQQKTFQKKLESAEKDKKGRPLGKDLDELTNIVFEKLKEGEHLISQARQTADVNLFLGHIHVSFKHVTGLIKRSKNIDMELGYRGGINE